MIGVVIAVIAVLIAMIYFIAEFRRFKHKFFAILLIALILFGYISYLYVFHDQEVDFKSVSGIVDAGKVYLSWLGSVVFDNLKTLTSNAVKMDWRGNQTS